MFTARLLSTYTCPTPSQSLTKSCYAGCAQQSVLPALKSFVVARIRLFQPFQNRSNRTHAHRCVTSSVTKYKRIVMKTHTLTIGRYLFIVAFSFITLTGCDSNSPEDSPPDLIPGEVFSLPVDLFSQSAGKAEQPSVNFTAAALRVWPVSLIISANLIIPSLTTLQALNAEPVFQDGVWQWTSSVQSGQQSVQFQLTADRIAGGTNWSMKISATDFSGQELTDFELFTGHTSNNGETGSWQLFYPLNDLSDNVLNAAYTFESPTQKSIVFSIPETSSLGAGGDSIDYVENGEDRTFIWLQGAENITHTIIWNSMTHVGSITATNFNGGVMGCWDATLDDIDCSPS